MQPLADVVRQPADRQDVAGTVKRERVLGRKTLVSPDLVVDGFRRGRRSEKGGAVWRAANRAYSTMISQRRRQITEVQPLA